MFLPNVTAEFFAKRIESFVRYSALFDLSAEWRKQLFDRWRRKCFLNDARSVRGYILAVCLGTLPKGLFGIWG